MMDRIKLQKIIDAHDAWLSGDGGERAKLVGANLINANLSRANLRDADLRYANLSCADLIGANLNGADLSGVKLGYANLKYADLRGAKLDGADLDDANLIGADLRHADLIDANLEGANLEGANLDYSVLPLCCDSLHAHFDDRQVAQIAYHLVKAGLQSINTSEDTKEQLKALIPLANTFHRVDEYGCGYIEE